MSDPLDTVAFLANSENRVRILETLVEEPRTRAELSEATEIARATLGRTLTDLEDRGWVTRKRRRYTTTAQGTHLVDEFRTMCDTVVALEEFGTLLEWLPSEEFGFDLGRFRDARITRPTSADSVAPIRRAGRLMSEAEDILGLTSVFAPDALRGNHDALGEGEQRFEVVFTPAVLDVVRADREARDLMRELLAAETTACYVYEDGLSYPYNIWVIDGEAVIGVSDEEGAPRALVETDDPAVRGWVRSTITTHRAEATRIGPDDLSA